MVASRRSTVVTSVALICAAATWGAVVPGLITASNALWITLGLALAAFVAAKFNRHAALPDSVKLH